MRIVFTGGGTGGHLFPIVGVVREMKRIAEEERILDLQLFYFGPEDEIPPLLRDEDVVFAHVISGKVRRYFSLLNFVDKIKIFFGIVGALWKMFFVMPDVVFSKGGYGSFPTLVAARIYRIPVIIHESDAIPGRVNQWAGTWAARIAVSFARTAKYFPAERVALTGVPIRKRVLGSTGEQAREVFGAFSTRPVLFIVGGSQGAKIINDTVTQILGNLLTKFEVIHQVGEKNFEDVRLETALIVKGEGEAYYHPVAFLDEEKLRAAYSLADLVISRAGSSIFEIAAWGKPSILIPLKNAAHDHQRENAYAYAEKGAAVVIEEINLTPSVLENEIDKLVQSQEKRKGMGEAAKSFARLDAAEVIAREILSIGVHE